MTLQIFEQLHPVPHDRNRFRILEVMDTVDGPRTRVTDKSFRTEDEARDFINPNRPKPAYRLDDDNEG